MRVELGFYDLPLSPRCAGCFKGGWRCWYKERIARWTYHQAGKTYAQWYCLHCIRIMYMVKWYFGLERPR